MHYGFFFFAANVYKWSCIIYGFFQEIFGNRWIEFLNIVLHKKTFIFIIFYAFKPSDYWISISPLINGWYIPNLGVNIFYKEFTNFTNFTFSWIYQSTFWVWLKILFMIFPSDECIRSCKAIHSFSYIVAFCNMFGFFVYGVKYSRIWLFMFLKYCLLVACYSFWYQFRISY